MKRSPGDQEARVLLFVLLVILFVSILWYVGTREAHVPRECPPGKTLAPNGQCYVTGP